MKSYYLKPQFFKIVTDYYGTAKVVVNGKRKTLLDCGEPIAMIEGIKAEIIKKGWITKWELMEIREFFRQDNFEVSGLNAKQFEEKYRRK